MNRRNQRSRFRTIMSSPITLVLSLVLLVLLGRAAFNIHTKAIEGERKLTEAQANLAKLETNRDSIQSRIAELSTDAGVEASMREKFHAVMPGESVAVIIDADAGKRRTVTMTATTSVSVPEVPKSWWQRFWNATGF